MDIPDRDIEAVGFAWDSFRTCKHGEKPWWKFWGGLPEIWTYDEFVWHYAKELGATPFSTFLCCYTEAQYRLAFKAVARLDADNEVHSPHLTVVLVPLLNVDAWCKRHRVLLVRDLVQATDLDNLITLHGQPQEQ